MKSRKAKKQKKTNFAMKLLIFFFVLYAGYTLTSQQIQIQKKIEENTALENEIASQTIQNEELQEMLENTDNEEYYAKIARDDLGYISNGERLFIDISSM